MKNKNKKYVLVTLAATVAVSAAVVLLLKKIQQQRKLIVVANDGYETAHDINFPLKVNSPKQQQRRGKQPY